MPEIIQATLEAMLRYQVAVNWREGPPPIPERFWNHRLDHELNGWKNGGSANHPLINRSAQVTAQPGEAAAWWQRFTGLELRGQLSSTEGNFGHESHEWGSSIYGPWTLLSKVFAYNHLRPCKAKRLLRKDIRRTLAMWSILAVPDLIVRRGEGTDEDQVIYRGPGVVSAGARSKGHNVAAGNYRSHLLAIALGLDHDYLAAKSTEVLLAETFPRRAWCLKPEDREYLRKVVWNQDLGDAPLDGRLGHLLGDLRTIVPVEIRWTHGDNPSVVSMLSKNPNGNTGANYYSIVPAFGGEARRIRYGYPYPNDPSIFPRWPRVRPTGAGKRWIAAGRCWIEDGMIYCQNRDNSPDQLIIADHLPEGPYTVFRFGPHHPPSIQEVAE